MTATQRGPVMLVVLDGFGIGDGGPADATALAHAPFFARARRELPMAKIETSGEAVGSAARPDGQLRGRPHDARRRAASSTWT